MLGLKANETYKKRIDLFELLTNLDSLRCFTDLNSLKTWDTYIINHINSFEPILILKYLLSLTI